MSYKIFKVFIFNYSTIFENINTKNEYSNLSYSDHLNKLLNEYIIETPGFSKKMNLMGNMSQDIIYNYYDLQAKWLEENNLKLDKDLNFEDKLYYIFEKQIFYFKPNVIFFRGHPPFDCSRIVELKDKFKFLKKIVCHNGFPNNELKNIDLVLSTTKTLNDFYKKKGLMSTLLYHSFDEEILKKVVKKNNSNEIVFCGQTGHTKSTYYKTRFNHLNELLINNFSIDCYSSEFFNKKIEFQIKNSKEKVRNFLLNIFKDKYINLFRFLDKKIKNDILSNFVSDLEKINNSEKYLHDLWPKKIHPPVFGLDMLNKIYNSDITINIHTDVTTKYCGNYRMFEATGLGSCLITEYRDNITELFEPDSEVVTYKNFSELKDKLKNLIGNEELCKKISIQGQKRTLKQHTLNSRLEFVDREIKKLI